MQKKFIDYADNLRKSVINQRAIINWLLLVILILSFSLAYVSTHHSEILIPYGLNKKISILFNRVTPMYLITLALADAETYFSVDRNNIDEQSSLFISRVSSNALQDIRKKLDNRATYFKSNAIAQSFYPYKRYKKSNKLGVVISGHLVRWLSGRIVFDKGISLDVDYVNINGHLYISHWSYQYE